MPRLPALALACICSSFCLADSVRILPEGKLPPDGRLAAPRTLDGYHPWTPPTSRNEWKQRRRELRAQVMVSQGLWPKPASIDMRPEIRNRIDRSDYTIETVILRTRPGHYLVGNLYRPKNKSGPVPAVLCPHGHWANGRLGDAGEAAAKDSVKGGGESYLANARFHLQALPASLARMGYVAFTYDMVGVADGAPLKHPQSSVGKFNGGFEDAGDILRLESFMGLQTWNSIRALDFVSSLPEVDLRRIAVTGGSGGGTQTFLLCAVDERPFVAFPAVMVSTGMQGGCVCENAPLLRVGTTNVELAAIHAPKPMGMTGADDWTKEIETKGLPELKALYRLGGAPDSVEAWCRPQFKHNYNQVSRELLYAWLNRHFKTNIADTKEKEFIPATIAELTAFDAKHPRPKDYLTIPELKKVWAAEIDAAYKAMLPRDQETLQRYREVVGTALFAMIVDKLPAKADVQIEDRGVEKLGDLPVRKLVLSRKQTNPLFPKEAVPVAVFEPAKPNGNVVVWASAGGHLSLLGAGNRPDEELQRMLAAGVTVVAPDVFLTGEFHRLGRPTAPPKIDPRYAGYFHCYNRSVVANRVHDLLTTVTYAWTRLGTKSVDLVGFGEAGPWALMAKGLSSVAVRRVVCDFSPWRFADIKKPDDPRMVPGALKYGDVPGFALLAAPGELFVADAAKTPEKELQLLKDVYSLAGAGGSLAVPTSEKPREDAMAWLLK